MRHIDMIYIDGAFVTPHGTRRAPLFNPATEEQIGSVRLGDETDVDIAVAAARRAYDDFSRTSVADRAVLLRRLGEAVEARSDVLNAAIRQEFAPPPYFLDFITPLTATAFFEMAWTLADYPVRRSIGRADVQMRPLGVAAAITPWNANCLFIATKLAPAIASGSPIVIKPSEMSAIQTQAMLECLHEVGIPKGVLNVVNGDGATVGEALSRHPGIAKISFTGSTATGRQVLAAASETMKRATLELGGKGPTILLDDADLDAAIPQALMAGFGNSGQACLAGTRILAPAGKLEEILGRLRTAVAAIKVGPPDDAEVQIGPMVSARQWERVQSYIRLGLEEGATLVTGGEGRPDGLNRGWFVRPTIFANVTNDMRIAREEIFGPVLCVIPYRDEEEAIRIANDSSYGLQAYVLSADVDHARRVAERIEAGRVVINDAPHDLQSPFGGCKQSGIGRENGVFGLEAFLEPRAVLV